MKVISITGTKGKTTLVFLLDFVLRKLGKKVLCVCSEGIFSNGKLIKNNEYFLQKYQTSANVVAIKELEKKDFSKHDYILLESSFANAKNLSNSVVEKKIDIGVLTNVYRDHVDGKKIKDRKELLMRKIDVLNNIKKGGEALIFTGDKKNSISHLAQDIIHKKRPDLQIIPYLGHADLNKISISYNIKKKCICRGSDTLLEYDRIDMPFKDSHMPTKNNLVALVGILDLLGISPHCLYGAKLTGGIAPGRMNLFSTKEKTILLDYAHEIQSLRAAAKMLRKQFNNKNIVAVVRLSYYRNRSNIRMLSKKLSKLFDSFIIYDKAISRKKLQKVFTYDKKTGEVAEIMDKIISKSGKPVHRVDDELEAIAYAVKKMRKNEVLYIMGDQMVKDIEAIRRTLS